MSLEEGVEQNERFLVNGVAEWISREWGRVREMRRKEEKEGREGGKEREKEKEKERRERE